MRLNEKSTGFLAKVKYVNGTLSVMCAISPKEQGMIHAIGSHFASNFKLNRLIWYKANTVRCLFFSKKL